MIEGDVVMVSGRPGEWLVVEVNIPDDTSLGVSRDMGRYTILAKNGEEITNSPGYLMSFLRHIEPAHIRRAVMP